MAKITKGTKFQFHSTDATGIIKEYSPSNVSYSWKHDENERTYNMSKDRFDKLLAVVLAD
ncbi:hypothetical protein AUR04nite_00020 [Glutamicibacter uratoxydans]|uniref:Uncharacterized protein n=1 Tax=Glutamicibacter uratoxydans TaxID=43667 RepID=A0A4Y4DLG7_GLUUR|nr:hypothetical protein [Glutamicibacter uratoxydans]GED04470.1 hypothetical protein AUR04nite_00020 [Glutamicibacter uratoxydans]